ncbi:MAG TPA: cytochrome c biogenesis protein DipZ [Anaerolineae bacterium]
MVITIFFAFLAGMVTVASPCILPILPIALSASAVHGRARPLGMILGLVASFSIFTLLISQIVALVGLSANTLRLAAVAIIALLGFSLIVPALNRRMTTLLGRLPGLAPARRRSGFWGGLLMGATLGLVWAPCAGPILAAITTLAATQQVTGAAVAVTAAYALGAGLPLLLIAYGGRAALVRIPTLARRSETIQRAFGGLMVLTAALIAFNADVALTAWATNALPAGWNDRLQAFEDTPTVRGRIDQLLGRTTTLAAAGSAKGSVASAATPAVLPGTDEGAAGNNRPSANVPAGPAPAARVPPAKPGQGEIAGPIRPALPTPAPVDLPDGGPAPDFNGITHWINSPALRLADLRGKVVLIDFWTYSCINCIRTLPYVTAWYARYKDRGLVVVGVHTPEFAFEEETPNVVQATQRYHISYPVAQDNNYATWNAYGNSYWPAEYIIDARGHLRHVHFGEGNYNETEMVIQQLLAAAGDTTPQVAPAIPAPVPYTAGQTPETYVGLNRQGNFASPEGPVNDQPATYSLPARLSLHSFALAGSWTLSDEFARVEAAGDVLRLHFAARDVYLVLASDHPATVNVSLPGFAGASASEDLNARGQLQVGEARLYHLAHLDGMYEATIELRFDQPGVRVYAFTFGG